MKPETRKASHISDDVIDGFILSHMVPHYPQDFQVSEFWIGEIARAIPDDWLQKEANAYALRAVFQLVGEMHGTQLPTGKYYYPPAAQVIRALQYQSRLCRWSSGGRACQILQSGAADRLCEWHHALTIGARYTTNRLEAFTEWIEKVAQRFTPANKIWFVPVDSLWSATHGELHWLKLIRMQKDVSIRQTAEQPKDDFIEIEELNAF